uniref:Exostosin GT47 domain-containing protein n=1 Tax=Chrysotila carterae TaxID=13221 RepID=A0A7S4BM90_CHRCT
MHLLRCALLFHLATNGSHSSSVAALDYGELTEEQQHKGWNQGNTSSSETQHIRSRGWHAKESNHIQVASNTPALAPEDSQIEAASLQKKVECNRTAGADVHDTDGEWKFVLPDGRPTTTEMCYVIPVDSMKLHLSSNRIRPVPIPLEQICHKGMVSKQAVAAFAAAAKGGEKLNGDELHDFSKSCRVKLDSPRGARACASAPPIVVKSSYNPCGLPYRSIDGTHRICALKNELIKASVFHESGPPLPHSSWWACLAKKRFSNTSTAKACGPVPDVRGAFIDAFVIDEKIASQMLVIRGREIAPTAAELVLVDSHMSAVVKSQGGCPLLPQFPPSSPSAFSAPHPMRTGATAPHPSCPCNVSFGLIPVEGWPSWVELENYFGRSIHALLDSPACAEEVYWLRALHSPELRGCLVEPSAAQVLVLPAPISLVLYAASKESNNLKKWQKSARRKAMFAKLEIASYFRRFLYPLDPRGMLAAAARYMKQHNLPLSKLLVLTSVRDAEDNVGSDEEAARLEEPVEGAKPAEDATPSEHKEPVNIRELLRTHLGGDVKIAAVSRPSLSPSHSSSAGTHRNEILIPAVVEALTRNKMKSLKIREKDLAMPPSERLIRSICIANPKAGDFVAKVVPALMGAMKTMKDKTAIDVVALDGSLAGACWSTGDESALTQNLLAPCKSNSPELPECKTDCWQNSPGCFACRWMHDNAATSTWHSLHSKSAFAFVFGGNDQKSASLLYTLISLGTIPIIILRQNDTFQLPFPWLIGWQDLKVLRTQPNMTLAEWHASLQEVLQPPPRVVKGLSAPDYLWTTNAARVACNVLKVAHRLIVSA